MNERHQTKNHGEILSRNGPVHPRRRFSPDRLRNPFAAGGRLFYVDQSDLHRPGHGVGRFHIKPDSAQTLEADYTHEWLYFLVMAWTIALLLITGTIIYRKCRVFESRKYAWVPLGIFLGGFALCALSFAEIYTFHKMPECFCLTFAAFWESCLQVGLMPTNGYYRYFFSESTVAAQIVDGQGRPVYRAQNAPDLTPAQLDAAAREAILLNADTRLQSAPVQDGRVYWVEDISKINRIQGQLAEINARLSEENELIQAENELKRQRAQTEEKNRLMDEMIALMQPQLFQISRLLEGENTQILNAQTLKQVCLLGAYVKRRVNLALICDQKAFVPVDELAHCVLESLTYLTQYGVVCTLHQEGNDSVSSRDPQRADGAGGMREMLIHSPDAGGRGGDAGYGAIRPSGEAESRCGGRRAVHNTLF